MSSAETSDLTGRSGFWILVGTTSFSVGYPILLSVVFSPHRYVVTAAIIFGVLGLLIHSGSGLARIVSAGLSGIVACLMLLALLRIIGLSPGPNHWPITLVIGIIPTIGFAVCSVLLCVPSVPLWQQTIRRKLGEWREAKNAAAQEAESFGRADIDLELCPWCEAVAVDPRKGFCQACNRPA